MALASSARVARAQGPNGPESADCARDFRAQVAEAIWLRDEEPQEEEAAPPGVSSGRQLDDRTRFSLAVVIGDLLLLREQSGTATWPRTLSRLSSQELRQRRDEPALDATACEIVRFMREHYSAERERDGRPLAKRPRPPEPELPQRASAPPPPREPRARDVAPPERRAPSATAATTRTARAAVPSTPIPPTPPTPSQRPVPSERPAPVRPAEVEAPDEPSPPAEPIVSEVRRGLPRTPRVEPSVEPTLTDQETPPPPPAVAPPEIRPAPAVEVRESPAPAPDAPPAPAPVEPAPEMPAERLVEATPPDPAPADLGQEQQRIAAAKKDLAALDAQLSVPGYLTLRAIRRDGASRPDDEVWRMRRRTLEARDELVDLLRRLAGEPERLTSVKALLGAQGCTRTEKRIRELYAGGPDSDKVDVALQLWKRQPNPD